jgi:hypothetical protein
MILWSTAWLAGRPLKECVVALLVVTACNLATVVAVALAVVLVR